MPPKINDLAVVILAAGLGTRMKSAIPKVNHQVAGRPLLGHVQAIAQGLNADQIIHVVGPENRDLAVPGSKVVQEDRLGTGHGVQMALPLLTGFEGWVLVLYGDSILIRPETLRGPAGKRHANRG